jgi:cold shock CspA family protein
MRTHGTLTKWNDDRGFGFIAPAKGDGDLFVHISAFPRDGVRPRVNELISFEIEGGPDGKRRAVRVMRPAQRSGDRCAATRDRQRPADRKLGVAITLLAIVGISAYVYSEYMRRISPVGLAGSDATVELASPPSRYYCDGRTMCSQMTSCDEATYFIRNCRDTRMDGDGDGVPCESQWCN